MSILFADFSDILQHINEHHCFKNVFGFVLVLVYRELRANHIFFVLKEIAVSNEQQYKIIIISKHIF